MIYNPKKVDNRRFKAVSLPSCKKLFERFGYSLGEKGHPDNTDPYKFTDPKFKSGVFPKDVDNSTLISGVTQAYKEVEVVQPKVEDTTDSVKKSESEKNDD